MLRASRRRVLLRVPDSSLSTHGVLVYHSGLMRQRQFLSRLSQKLRDKDRTADSVGDTLVELVERGGLRGGAAVGAGVSRRWVTQAVAQ